MPDFPQFSDKTPITSLSSYPHAEPPGQVDGWVQEGGVGLLPAFHLHLFIVDRHDYHLLLQGDGYLHLFPFHPLVIGVFDSVKAGINMNEIMLICSQIKPMVEYLENVWLDLL